MQVGCRPADDSMEGVICSQSLSNLHYVICDRIDDWLAATFFFFFFAESSFQIIDIWK